MNKIMFRTLVLMVGISLSGLFASAQGAGGASGGKNSAMIKLFGDLPAFSGNATVQVLTSNRVETMRMPSVFTALNGSLRIDVDEGLIKSPQVPPSDIAKLKASGLDRVNSVNRPDKKMIYIIYPHVQSYAAMPLSAEDADLANEKLTRIPIGKETIDAHPCVKNHSVVKNAKGVVLIEAVTWNATDLQNFPIQIEVKENGNTSVTHFQSVSFARPDARLFDPPAGFKQYSDPADLGAAALKRLSVPKKK